jgi:hypothetical protein
MKRFELVSLTPRKCVNSQWEGVKPTVTNRNRIDCQDFIGRLLGNFAIEGDELETATDLYGWRMKLGGGWVTRPKLYSALEPSGWR